MSGQNIKKDNDIKSTLIDIWPPSNIPSEAWEQRNVEYRCSKCGGIRSRSIYVSQEEHENTRKCYHSKPNDIERKRMGDEYRCW